MYSPTTSKHLINNLINNNDNNDNDIIEKIKRIRESTYIPNDSEDINHWLSINWKKRISSDYDDIIIDNNDNSIMNSNDIIGVICESDCGLRISEIVSDELNLPSSNGIFEGRRDKYMMQESLKYYLNTINNDINVKLRRKYEVLQQVLTDDWNEAKMFLSNLKDTSTCVIKPSRGSASLDVYKATNIDEAKTIFEKSLGNPGYANGTISDAILVQEYIEGQEFVVDTVSSDGVHKAVANWMYDKRSVNGASFVYFCTELVQDNQNDMMHEIQEYALLVLEALGVKNGPCHIEIMYHKTRGPLLIEANCGRWHCQDYTSICDKAYSCNQASSTVDAYIRNFVYDDSIREIANQRFNKIPKYSPKANVAARIVHLNSFVEGELKNLNHQDTIYQLKSLLTWVLIYDTIGETVKRTINLHSVAGCHYYHHYHFHHNHHLSSLSGWGILLGDKETVDHDYTRLMQLQETMIEVVDKD